MTGRLPKFFTLISLVAISLSTSAQENKLPQYEEGWWQQVAAAIAESEYEIRGGAAEHSQAEIQAVNRAQNLRAEFSASGVTVKPRVEQEATWSIGLSLMGLEQYGAPVPASIAERKVEDRTLTYLRGDIVESYKNEKSGILLNIDLSGSAKLDENTALAIQLDTGLETVIGDNGTQVEFYSDGIRVARIGLRASSGEGGGRPTAILQGNKLLILASRSVGPSNRVQLALTGQTGEDTQVGPSTAPNWILNEEQAGSEFSFSIAAAGDIDGDSFSDVIVGAPEFDIGQPANAGRVLIFRGSANGLATTPGWTWDGEEPGGRFGSSVASAGNFDADVDNISDIVVGADVSNIAIVFAGSTSGNLSEVSRFDGIEGKYGFSVDSAGDINGDGAGDIVVGAPAYENNGRAYVHFSPFGMSQTSGTSYCLDVPDKTCSGQQFGYSVSGAGDVDGDGKSDLIIGAPFYDQSGPNCNGRGGEAFVYLGSSLDNVQNANECNAVPDWRSQINGGQAGFSVDTAGDVDADGYDDVIVGAPSRTHIVNEGSNFCGQSIDDSGAAMVFRATPLGNDILEKRDSFNSHWRAIGHDGTATSQLSTEFGAFVASAGDINGDGAGDILVGAPAESSLASDGGAAFLYLGSVDAGMQQRADQVNYRNLVGCSSADSTNLAFLVDADWSFFGTQTSANLGQTVAGAGDVDGDGFSDILAAERGQTSVFRGAAYTPSGDFRIYQAFEGLAAFVGDFDGDGFDDLVAKTSQGIVVYAGTDSNLGSNPEDDDPDWVLRNRFDADDTVAGAGDINGDGFADIIVGLPSANQVRIFKGGSQPDTFRAAWVITAAAGSFGSAVSSAGDVNGDGFADVIVGDSRINSNTGKAWVFKGTKDILDPDPGPTNFTAASSADWSAEGSDPLARFGHSVSSAGDVNADGYSDVIVGAPGDGVDILGDTGEAFVYLGSPFTPLEAQFWTAHGSGQPGGEFGAAVASAGDVNGDGFGDIVVGAPGTDLSGLTDVGQAFAYLGSAVGLSFIEAWSADGLRDGDRLGQAVGNAGDINADGLSDLVAGPFLFLGSESGVSSEPAWPDENIDLGSTTPLVGASMSGGSDFNGDGFDDFSIDGRGPFFGNTINPDLGRSSIPRAPRQLNLDETPVAPLGKLEPTSGLSFLIRIQRPDAPGRLGLEWEIKPLGEPFDGTGLQRSIPDDMPGNPLTAAIDQLDPGTPYRWRARVVSNSVTTPHSPWLSVSGGTQGAHVLTAGARATAFGAIGPVQNTTVFADSPSLLFQWRAGGETSFEVQWSGNSEFLEPVVSSGSQAATGYDIESYRPDDAMWLEILGTAQNPDFREAPVFWRITANGSAESETRALRLAAAAGPIVSSPADGQTVFISPSVSWDVNHNERFQIRFSANDFLGEPLIIVADEDDIADAADDFNITGTGMTIPDAIWSEVEALVPPGADGTGTVYFAVRGIDALSRPSISEVRSLRVSATGTAAPQPPAKKKGGGGSTGWLLLTLLALLFAVRRFRLERVSVQV